MYPGLALVVISRCRGALADERCPYKVLLVKGFPNTGVFPVHPKLAPKTPVYRSDTVKKSTHCHRRPQTRKKKGFKLIRRFGRTHSRQTLLSLPFAMRRPRQTGYFPKTSKTYKTSPRRDTSIIHTPQRTEIWGSLWY